MNSEKQLDGWYYLHTNGQLLYKKEFDGTSADLRDSNFVRAIWPMRPAERVCAWRILVEALALGADKLRVLDLAKHWSCNDEDATNYADYLGFNLYRDGDMWCATKSNFVNLQESPVGFGPSCLEAISNLCKDLGFAGCKLGWEPTFASLVKST